jgi:hypothetical protein
MDWGASVHSCGRECITARANREWPRGASKKKHRIFLQSAEKPGKSEYAVAPKIPSIVDVSGFFASD